MSNFRQALSDGLQRFMAGVTFFHVAGIVLLVGGANYGAQTKIGGSNLFGTGFDFGVTLSFTQIIGGVTFFYELIKAKFSRKPEQPAPPAGG